MAFWFMHATLRESCPLQATAAILAFTQLLSTVCCVLPGTVMDDVQNSFVADCGNSTSNIDLCRSTIVHPDPSDLWNAHEC